MDKRKENRNKSEKPTRMILQNGNQHLATWTEHPDLIKPYERGEVFPIPDHIILLPKLKGYAQTAKVEKIERSIDHFIVTCQATRTDEPENGQ